VLLTTAFFSFFSLKINFEEDISSLLPSTDNSGTTGLVFSNLKVKDKIFILFHSTSDETTPFDLMDVCDQFIETLLEKDTINHSIGSVLYQLDVESLLQNGISFLYENAPVFLDSAAYPQIDRLSRNEQVELQMAENYSILRSPAGMAFKEAIRQDPIAFRNIFLTQMGNMAAALGGNYTIMDGHIFTPDTTTLVAFLSPNFKSFDSKQGIRLAEMIEMEIKHFRTENTGVEILYHGSPVQSVYNSRRIKTDLVLTISVSLILILVVLLICFRNKSTILHLILPVVYGVLFSLAIIYFIKGSMSLMALGIGAIVMGVAFSYCMHVITHFKYVSDPETVLKDQTTPVILGSLTTIGAFMGLMLTKSELLRDFGLFASLGLVGTTIACLLFLPQFFNPANNRKSEKAFTALEKINSFPFEKQKWLIGLLIVVSVVCFFVSDKVKFDSDLRNIGYDNANVVRSRNLLASKTTGNASTVYFASVAEELDSALVYNRRLCEKLDELVAQRQIAGYASPASLFVPLFEQEKRIELWNNYWTKDKKEALENTIIQAGKRYNFRDRTFEAFFNLLDADYSPVSLYDAGIVPDELMENIVEHTDDKYMVFVPVRMDKKRLLEIGEKIVAQNVNFVVIDPMYYTGEMVNVIHDDFNTTLMISSLFVLIVLLCSYRNIVLALIGFLPMGFSWYIVLGTMAIFGMEFNLINIVISTFIFGIGVDYSIFIMDGLLHTHRTKSPVLIYHKTAIFLSALILIIVIVSLMFAVHPAISSIGLSTLTGMVSTMLIAYTLLPFLFNLYIKWREKRRKGLL
jgi:predicted RND superfamily exporter protein